MTMFTLLKVLKPYALAPIYVWGLFLSACTSQSENTPASTSPGSVGSKVAAGKPAPEAKLTIAIQPLGKVDATLLAKMKNQLSEAIPFNIRLLNSKPLPKSAYYAPRGRYRADSLLDWLNLHKPDDCYRIMGFTTKDISTTKGKYVDWGIMGLGQIRGPACVVSSFRVKKACPGKQFESCMFKNCLHELGHTFGRPHCTASETCVMIDLKGKGANIRKSQPAFCSTCNRKLKTSIFGLLDF